MGAVPFGRCHAECGSAASMQLTWHRQVSRLPKCRSRYFWSRFRWACARDGFPGSPQWRASRRCSLGLIHSTFR
jgi:hypothetical protein